MKQVTLFTGLFFALILNNMAQTGTCKTDVESIFNGPNGEIFQTEYKAYTANQDVLSKGNFSDLSIKVVLGNWCSDSQREVPRFIRLSETRFFENVPVDYYLVNEDKFCPDPEVQKLDVKYVPAIIFYRNGKELGRMIETPEGTLEEHVVKILNAEF